jgi:predicted dehydrogenase
MKIRQSGRREFLRHASVATLAAGVGYWSSRAGAESRSASEKLNIGIIGAGGQGASNLKNVASENIVALCDVDLDRAAAAFQAHPKATVYRDFRKLLEEHKRLDAVVVSTPDHMHAFASIAAMRTPDHTHAAATVMAMKRGLHVYCEKPLTHSVAEARTVRRVAAEAKVATQMGTQGSSHLGLRRAAELVKAGAIGPVREIHAWSDRPIWPQAIPRPADRPQVPPHLDWDLWLGPAPARAYHPAYLPFSWRGWWDFGTGALGDMACHVLNMAFLALALGYPATIEARQEGNNAETAPNWSVIRYQFPARGKLPAVELTWYDGGQRPPAEVVGQRITANGSLLVGERGRLYARDDFGSSFQLFQGDRMVESAPPAEPAAEIAHHREWINACKTGSPTLANFDFGAVLTEAVLLGNVAIRTGKKIVWNSAQVQAAGCPDADALLKRQYRAGWTL